MQNAAMMGFPLRGQTHREADSWDHAFFRFNNKVDTSVAGNIAISLPIPHGAKYASYLGLGGGGGAGQNTVAGNGPGGGGAGALAILTFGAPFHFDRVEAQIGYGGQQGADSNGSDGGDTLLDFYWRGEFLYRLKAGLGGRSLSGTGSAGGAGGTASLNRRGQARVPQIGRRHPANTIAGLLLLDGLAGETGEARGNDIGGDGGDSFLSYFTRRFNDNLGALGGLVNNDPASAPSGGQGWGTGGGAGVGAGASLPGKGGGVALLATDRLPHPAVLTDLSSITGFQA